MHRIPPARERESKRGGGWTGGEKERKKERKIERKMLRQSLDIGSHLREREVGGGRDR